MKKTIIILIVLALVGVGYFYLTRNSVDKVEVIENQEEVVDTATTTDLIKQKEEALAKPETIIGTSVNGNPINAYHYGKGSTNLLFVGGIHGGYSWNTALVAYELMDYLKATPNAIPENVRVTVIPVLNPDGLEKVLGTADRFQASDVKVTLAQSVPGRFNANKVDLNRNFDCDWQAKGTWQDKTVSGGSAVFSEPETLAIKNYIEGNNPEAVIVWYSAVGGVFASNCYEGVLPETRELTNAFAKASGYKAYEEFNFYEITGDMVNWLAKKKIPAISVLLTTHESTEWSKNLAGIKAIFDLYRN